MVISGLAWNWHTKLHIDTREGFPFEEILKPEILERDTKFIVGQDSFARTGVFACEDLEKRSTESVCFEQRYSNEIQTHAYQLMHSYLRSKTPNHLQFRVTGLVFSYIEEQRKERVISHCKGKMPILRTCRPQGGSFGNEHRSSFSGRCSSNNNNSRDFAGKFRDHVYNGNNEEASFAPSSKKRKFSAFGWEDCGRYYRQPGIVGDAPSTSNSSSGALTGPDTSAHTYTSRKRDYSKLEDDVIFMSRDEIERCSPSRKDGIDSVRETYLRYSYCAFLQNLGMRLELPQTTTGTAMVLCHRFFVRRSHACYDRFLIATAALFLAAKSEETARPLNNVLRASCEICQEQDLTFFSYMLPVDWFEQYRERVIEAEQMILTTLDFELNVQHPYVPLTSVLNKLGLSRSVLVNLALNLVSEGLRSSLWLQFKPHHIAAGAAYLAAKFLNFDLTSYQNIWQEFQTTLSILTDVVQQLMELF
ncbi:hypothetical protein NE237_015724 [Protea cynaroides]|uniref:Cyclin-like domain-containing protein n=1 Tax=Protea cynaroides TaxID=273540 RepID=A0A9Q0KEC7_9MAGN|nr:hypothetical protein NE237_015724 [Protea cynaroides]